MRKRKKSKQATLRSFLVALAGLLSFSSSVMCAEIDEQIAFDIPQTQAGDALNLYAQQAGVQLMYPFKNLQEVVSNQVKGTFTKKDALDRLLSDTGYAAEFSADGTITIRIHDDNNDEGRPMKTRNKFLAALLSIFGATQVTGAADAVEADSVSEQSAAIEEVIVTATKTGETDLQKTALSITAFSNKLLDSINAFRLTDLTETLPNVQFGQWGTGIMVAYVRGIGTSVLGFGGEATVGFYLDGVYLDKGFGANTHFYDVERIEVLRGPQGTSYGRNTTGGAVNIVTKRPSDELEIDLGVEVGDYGKRRLDAMISGPIVKDKVKGRLSFSTGKHDGYLKNLSGPDLLDDDYYGLRGSLELTPTDKLNIMLRGDYYESDSHALRNRLMSDTGLFGGVIAPGVGIPKSNYLPNDLWLTSQNEESIEKYEIRGISADVEYYLPRNQVLKSVTAYRKIDYEQAQDMDGTSLPLFAYFIKNPLSQFTQELQLHGSSARWKWLLGLYYLNQTDKRPSGPNFMEANFIIPGLIRWEDGEVETEAWASFGNLTYAITDKFSVEAGIRYSYEKKKMDFFRYYTNIPFPPFNRAQSAENRSWDEISWKFGAQHQMTEEVLLFANVSKGFKSGMYARNNPVGENWVDPEFLLAYEIGLKSSWFDRKLRANAAAFYYDYTDLQVNTITPLGTVIKNAADSTIKGVELELWVVPINSVILNGSVSYLDSKFEEFIATGGVNVSGNSLPLAPKWKASFGAQYTLPAGNYGFLTFRGDLSWTDDQFFDEFNIPEFGQESYTLVNGSVKFETAGGHWAFEIYGKNLGEKEYLVNTMNLIGDVMGQVGNPRIFGFQVTYKL